MTHLPHADSFHDLKVYQKSRELAKTVFEITKSFPKDEVYSLTSQIRRASRSVGAQIAEAWAKRRYERHFLSKLTDADAEQRETQHWIEVASDCGYLDASQLANVKKMLAEIGQMLNGMMTKASLFCGDDNYSIHEAGRIYNSPED